MYRTSSTKPWLTRWLGGGGGGKEATRQITRLNYPDERRAKIEVQDCVGGRGWEGGRGGDNSTGGT